MAGREIRVFISSTFRDMREDRDELVKRVFPRLRRICEDRHVTWGEVDLRWGITDEEKAEGKVLPVCLEEIKRCGPYFIGLLGERYGWIPPEEDIPADLLDQQPWLAEHPDHSVTELEILHGVLRNPEMASHAFFYFRDPAYVEGRPPEKFREVPTDEEVRRFGREQAERRAEERREKLDHLKDRIRDTDFPVREDYADPHELGRLVLEDFTRLIDRLYPEEEVPDPLEREAREHEEFALSRASVYIGRPEYFDRLDAHAAGDGPPLAVLGESGSGKSALLSNWALGRRTEHPDEHLILHFIGASPYSADWRRMLRRIMGELKRRFEIEQDIPADPGELRRAFGEFLYMADARGQVVIVLDALNRLEARGGARELTWLPPVVPENVRLVVSTLPGPALEAVRERGWPTLAVHPLTHEEKLRLIDEFLGQYTKHLSRDRGERIASAPQTENPLYLRVLLDELRQFGEHERLGERIAHYLTAEDPDDLYGLVLERWEADYERDRPGLVADAMRALWAVRRGLSEAELLEFLGSPFFSQRPRSWPGRIWDGLFGKKEPNAEEYEPLPAAHWAPLRLAAGDALISRSGLLTFGHDYLRIAARQRYLPEEKQQKAAHAALADYFEAQELTERQVDELPWQLSRAEQWRRLYDLLADLRFFAAAWDADEEEVLARWAEVESHSDLRRSDAYRPVLDAPERHREHAWNIAKLFWQGGGLAEALGLRQYLVERCRKEDDRANLQGSLGNQALILKAQGDLDGAMKLHKEGERICRELGLRASLQASLGNQALILADRGDLDGAMKLHKEGERICRELGLRASLQTSLGNQANVLYQQGDLDGAMKLHKQQERICRELGVRASLQASLGNQALILADRGDLDGAMKLYKQEERICRELGLRANLQASLGNQASVLYQQGDLDGAMKLYKEEERICRELGLPDALARSLGGQALVLADRGDLDGAMKLHKEGERICRELGLPDELARSLGAQALILKAQGDLDGAMKLHKEEERICRELGLPDELARSLGAQALVLTDRGDLDGALPLVEDAHRLATEHGYATLGEWTGQLLDIIRGVLM